MHKPASLFDPEYEWFIRRFADDNDVDFLQLCVMDTLDHYGGSLTLMRLYSLIPASNVDIRIVLEELYAQGMIVGTADYVSLDDYAAWVLEDLLHDLRTGYARAQGHRYEEVPDLFLA